MQGATTLFLKDLNTRTVRSALRQAGSATCRELSAVTGLSQVTVGGILQALVERREALDDDWAPSNGGRPARRYRYAERRQLVLAAFTREIDARDTLCLRVCDLTGRVVEARDSLLGSGALEAFEAPIAALLAEHPAVAALGFALPGFAVDGVIAGMDYGALVGTRFEAHFEQRFGLPVVLENDVNAAVMGSGGTGTEAYLYFPRKYAPGAGLRVAGRLHRGRRNFAGEVGWLPLGVHWGEELTSSVAASCEAVARVITSLASVLAPDSIVLFGEFLTPEHVARVERQCGEQLPPDMLPPLRLTQDFSLDVQTGLIGLTLELVSL